MSLAATMSSSTSGALRPVRATVRSTGGASTSIAPPRPAAVFVGKTVRATPMRATRPMAYKTQAAASAETVKLNLQGRNVEVTDAMRGYVQEKVTHACSSFAGAIKSIDVTLSVRGGDTGTKGPVEHKVDVTIRTLRTGVVRVEDVEESMYAAIDLVCDKVQRSLRKTKEKAMKRGKWQGHSGAHQTEVIADVIDSTDFADDIIPVGKVAKLPEEVVRSKYFFVEPMSIEEATEQLEQLGHDFYVFQEAESGSIQVVYKRNTRGYGHIVPMPIEKEE